MGVSERRRDAHTAFTSAIAMTVNKMKKDARTPSSITPAIDEKGALFGLRAEAGAQTYFDTHHKR
jgi:hypothetical protein